MARARALQAQDPHGRFSIRIPAGPSRTLRFVYSGASGVLGAARSISYRVPASSTIHASRTRLFAAGRVRFSGRLRTRGQRIPGRGLVLVLQGRERGGWRPGTYPIRLKIRRQTSYPFELGYSRALTVRVS